MMKANPSSEPDRPSQLERWLGHRRRELTQVSLIILIVLSTAAYVHTALGRWPEGAVPTQMLKILLAGVA